MLPSKRAEKIKLNLVVDADRVVRGHANQTEWPGMVELIENIDAN